MSAGLLLGLLCLGALSCGSSAPHERATHVEAAHPVSRQDGPGPATPAGSTSGGRSSVADQNAALSRQAVVREGRDRGYLNDRDSDAGVPGSTNHYRDLDDSRILPTYGSPTNAATRRAVSAVVQRYYVLARAGDGRAACRMLLPSVQKAAPIDHGKFGVAYQHGAKTCPEVLTRLFKHQHSELMAPVHVTNVLRRGKSYFVLLGSTRMRASFTTVTPYKRGWAVVGILGGPIA
jgi:hypothetical protein